VGGSKGISPSILLFSILAMLLAACGEPLATPEPIFIEATGSMVMAPLVSDLADAYQGESPLVTVEVTGLGTQVGLEALRAGEVEVALASWLPSDPPSDWRTTAIARDGIAIIVHPNNPVGGLGLLQLRDIFSGRVYEWRAVGGRTAQGEIQPVSREDGSGTRAAFEALVLEERAVTPLALVAPSPQAVVEYVAEHPNAIGYVSMGHLVPDVKVLLIEGALPTSETAGEGSYPLTRELWLITAGHPPAAVQAFVNFALSPAGQQIVGRRFGRVK
jgi:phosphate transport system substrate-binding protein